MLTRRQRPLAHDLADTLAERIAGGKLAPGTRLPTEAAFMDEFGVSRTVVREALSKLQQTTAWAPSSSVPPMPARAFASARATWRRCAT
jgi:DNA-binding FadR family transcriptional regulator